MAVRIKKVQFIKRMAVFQDFNWDPVIRDSGNNIAEFKEINIFFGRNYSGKTTLSRIVRALETGVISEKYENPEFNLALNDNRIISQHSLLNHGQTVRVFNEDFVKENLRFIIDDSHSINSFAILGDDNNKIEGEISTHEFELGSDLESTGLFGKLKEAKDFFDSAKKSYDDTSTRLEDKLKDKANKAGTGIKHNKTYGDANYNVPKLKKDLETISTDKYAALTEEKIDELHQLLKEEAKPVVPESTDLNLKFSALSKTTKELIEKKISVSEPIQELLDDAVLQAWVRTGRQQHEFKRSTCGFCGNPLPENLWGKLDKHFNQESEQLRNNIDGLLRQVESEISRIPNILNINSSAFYAKFVGEVDEIKLDIESTLQKYKSSLELLVEALTERNDNIFKHLIFIDPQDVSVSLNNLRIKYEDMRIKSNQFTESLIPSQNDAKKKLRLHEVSTFGVNIQYSTECADIVNLKNESENAEVARDLASKQVTDKKLEIAALKGQLKDESKGAERVNDILNNYFGNQSLFLKAVENTEDKHNKTYQFEITRNDKKAYHLSEGECSLIAFCYFMAKLNDVETKGNMPIIWIDDPISSLDANHVFFVYSLINAEIVKSEKFNQLFVSTHNLDFLKYLKRLPGASNNKKSQYFIIQRSGKTSNISLMPGYLKNYVTEFNFLFHQLYKCANADISNDDNHDSYYNFGNNSRKFLEVFLYYKYPNAIDSDDKLARFFGDDTLASSLIDRINNEYSHLSGVFERSVMPIDVPEMKSTAQFILNKIREKDIDQYNALLSSIGVSAESSSPIEAKS